MWSTPAFASSTSNHYATPRLTRHRVDAELHLHALGAPLVIPQTNNRHVCPQTKRYRASPATGWMPNLTSTPLLRSILVSSGGGGEGEGQKVNDLRWALQAGG